MLSPEYLLYVCLLWQALRATGFKSLAVVLKHAAIFPDNEKAVGQVARELGFTQVSGFLERKRPSRSVFTHAPVDCCCVFQVSLSHEVMQMVKMVPRGYTATADAYLTPHIMRCAALQCTWPQIAFTCYVSIT